MTYVGDRIRMLRKNKGLTQEQLAEVLSTTFQTVSKWENGASKPDLDLLPVIAEFFGVSIDELFGYKANTLQFKERVIKFMVDNGVLRFGQFSLQSHRVSPYYININKFKSGAQIAKLGDFFAEYVSMNHIDSNVIFGADKNGQALAVATAITLYYKNGMDVEYCFEQNPNVNDEFFCGKELKSNDKVTILCATITTGNTLRNAIRKLKKKTGVEIKNVIVLVDRMESGNLIGNTSIRELEDELQVNFSPIITLEDIINAINNNVIAGKEYVTSIREYIKNYE